MARQASPRGGKPYPELLEEEEDQAQEKEKGGARTWSEQTTGATMAATAARAESTAAPGQARPGSD
jgi:hypothetical protein